MFQKLKFLVHFLKFSQDPTDTMEVFRFTDALVDGSTAAERAAFSDGLLADPGSRVLYEMHNPDYLRKPFDLDALAQCRPGTLGHSYATMMRAAGLDPEFFAYNKVEDASSFFTLRLRKTHDIYHVLTGFGTDVPGEIGLQAFYLGQLHMPVPLSIMTSALLNIITTRDPAKIRSSLEQIVHGYEQGVRAKKLHGIIWENLWDEDLATVRAQLGITKYEQVRLAA